ncbi:Lysophospholipid acyltransferase [Coemansia biformis]|uniref:Lysophospholipid acyltransferase n=1 Tax=Coemansia biformis TaxID=1286918 RepID=A0A9W7YDR6_9FUNG|nr:Lysophospholipid acyltransferase [Coemansia biformis]
MQLLNQAFAWLSERYFGGIPADNIAIIVGVLLSYALAHVFRRIPADMPAARHVFSVVSSVISYGIVQGHSTGVVHLAVGSIAIYILMCNLRGPAMPRAVFLAAMVHMSYSHIRRQMSEAVSGRIEQDYTGAQMVFVMKVTSLANCIHDGQRGDRDTLTGYQRKNAIRGVPGLLEYLGYVFFFPAFAIGPAFEMATYRRMVTVDSRCVASQLTRRAYKRLVESLVWMAVYVRFSHVTFAEMVSNHDMYARRSFVVNAFHLCAAGLVARAAFYTAWKMSEGACILAGLGFDGFDAEGNAQWMDIANIHVRGVELGTSLREMVDSWNIGTNVWLRHHVYLRVSPPRPAGSARTSSTRVTLLTFLVSAWWHGFYPGYYLTFMMGALASSAARVLRRNLRPLVVPTTDGAAGQCTRRQAAVKAVYDFVGWLLGLYTLSFLGAPFMLMWARPSLLLWRYNYFALPLAVLAIFVAFNIPSVKRRLRQATLRAAVQATE